MTEKEKCKNGLLYNANYDKELVQERNDCKDLCFQYNSLMPSDTENRNEIMKKILGNIQGSFLIESNFWCDYGFHIEIGDDFYANHNLVILDCAKVTFGKHVFIGPNCGFYTAGHPMDVEKRNEGLEYAYPITVGDNVWIGGNVVVMPGVTIGNNTVIGGGSVVTKNIPSGVVAAGNPCKVLKQIEEE